MYYSTTLETKLSHYDYYVCQVRCAIVSRERGSGTLDSRVAVVAPKSRATSHANPWLSENTPPRSTRYFLPITCLPRGLMLILISIIIILLLLSVSHFRGCPLALSQVDEHMAPAVGTALVQTADRHNEEFENHPW